MTSLGCWNRCDDVDHSSREGVRVYGAGGHAQRIRRADGGCRTEAGSESTERRAVLVRKSQLDSCEGAVLGRDRSMRVREASGAGSVFVSMERERLDGATDSERTATVFGRKQASRKNIVVSTGDDAFFTCQENSNMIKSVVHDSPSNLQHERERVSTIKANETSGFVDNAEACGCRCVSGRCFSFPRWCRAGSCDTGCVRGSTVARR